MKLNLEQLEKVYGGTPTIHKGRFRIIMTPVPGAPGFFTGQVGRQWFIKTPDSDVEILESKNDIGKFIRLFQLGKLLQDACIDEDSLDYNSYDSSDEISYEFSFM